MGSTDKSGFTIIETMLFLAITGLMVVAILIGTGATINIQRYRDSVTTLKSYLQSQYTDVANVRNEKVETGISCDTNAVASETMGEKLPRGQSECTIMGKYIQIKDGDINTSTVLGYGLSSTSKNDIDDLKSYKLSSLSGSTETTKMEWGTRIAWPKSGPDSKSPTSPRYTALLILRSPNSGTVYTFISENERSNLSDLVIAGSSNMGQGQSSVRLCVESDGLASTNYAVFINAFASGPSSIETRTNDMGDLSKC